MISARKAKQLDATTMFTYSHGNTPLGQSERAYHLSYFINHYGFRGIINNWFESFLCNRSQTLEINKQLSDAALISYGVPQGSVLGPLLFLLYINDIHTCSDTLNFYLFADDSNILHANKNLRSLEATVNSELKKLYLWLASNKLTLNTKKNNFVIFHPYQKSFDYLQKLKISDTDTNQYVSLEMKNYVKYFGILIDKNLSWKMHIDNVATKLFLFCFVLFFILFYFHNKY